MWYGFYGETLSSGSAFDGRMDGLCREIGGRGRADVPVVDTSGVIDHACVSSDTMPLVTCESLQTLPMRDVLRLAREAKLSEDVILEAQDAEDPKYALVVLLLAARCDATDDAASPGLRAELEGMRMKELMARAKEQGIGHEALLGAQENEQPKAALVELLLRHDSKGRRSAPSLH
jgi:hypothetical protein